MQRAFIIACFSATAIAPSAAASKVGETQVNGVRVQCLSPLLIRVEPKKGQAADGTLWFEDRNTFMVQNRGFAGEPITKQEGNKVETKHYTVMVTSSGPGKPNFMIFDKGGKTVYDAGKDANKQKHMLFWPAPGAMQAYAVEDSPRFIVPDWACAPLYPGAKCDANLVNTNGYDFGVGVEGDTYVFLLGSGVDDWNAARAEFSKLTGPVPLLPDFAFGTWWTWWHWYTQESARAEVEVWTSANLPIDVWGLDMEWRLATQNQDHFYDKPNGTAFPDWAGWFGFLKMKKLRTYFNDHPYPAGPQCSKAEIDFRYNGLTNWMSQGLDFWWFDHNWKYCMPPPNTHSLELNANWNGLTNVAWGAHVYYTTVDHYNKYGRDKTKDAAYMPRPVILTKYSQPDWTSGMDPHMASENPDHHRYPVWWTGDKIPLQAAVESMLDAGVHHLKPYVHSDCGGDEWVVKAGAFMRWIAMCAFGNILRIHGSDHRPWIYGGWWEDDIRRYLQIRYRLMPSIVAGGQRASRNGFPLAARLDLYWPEHWQQSTSNHQYIFLDDLLVAPIFNGESNMTSASVWIPPGEWQDVWTGDITKGPKQVTSWQPWERQPMWHRRDGALYVMVDDPKLRIRDQDWSQLTLDAFVCKDWCPVVRKKVYDLSDQNGGTTGETDVEMGTDGRGNYRFNISKASDGKERAWTLRINMRPGQRAMNPMVDGKEVAMKKVVKIAWDDGTPRMLYFPFGAKGSPPAARAGNVMEISVEKGAGARVVTVSVGDGYMGRTFCSWQWEDCLDTHCCKLSSQKCFEKNPFFGTCNDTCNKEEMSMKEFKEVTDTEPWSCKNLGAAPPPHKVDPAKKPKPALGTSLFCFAVVDGADEQELADTQKRKKAGVFGCEGSLVVKQHAGNASTAFYETWNAVKEDGEYKKHDWTVKAWLDAVFIPERLQKHLAKLGPPAYPGELYLKTTKHGVGLVPDFLVFSSNGVSAFLKHAPACKKNIAQFDSDHITLAMCADAYDIGYMEDTTVMSKNDDADCGEDWAVFLGHTESKSWLACYSKAAGDADTVEEFEKTPELRARLSALRATPAVPAAAARLSTPLLSLALGVAGILGVAAVAIRRAPRRSQLPRGGQEGSALMANEPVEN